jgi:hypothetical protein
MTDTATIRENVETHNPAEALNVQDAVLPQEWLPLVLDDAYEISTVPPNAVRN